MSNCVKYYGKTLLTGYRLPYLINLLPTAKLAKNHFMQMGKEYGKLKVMQNGVVLLWLCISWSLIQTNFLNIFKVFKSTQIGAMGYFYIQVWTDPISNIYKSFEKKLNKNFPENNVKFLNIGSCSLLIVHNAFQKVLTCLTIDLDQIPCDNFFFKLSFSCKNVTNSNFHKEVIMVFIGTTAKYCFAKNLIPDKKQGVLKRNVFFFLLQYHNI